MVLTLLFKQLATRCSDASLFTGLETLGRRGATGACSCAAKHGRKTILRSSMRAMPPKTPGVRGRAPRQPNPLPSDGNVKDEVG